MSEYYQQLATRIGERFGDAIVESKVAHGELTIEPQPERMLEVCQALRDEEGFRFEQLMDVCGVDYLDYGRGSLGEREFHLASPAEQAVNQRQWDKPRFAAVYHLLSVAHNHRVRLRCFAADADFPILPSVIGIWSSANWFEREAFDLYGIVFEGHPDLRRILTDYGFVGHPFRKDFPVIGNVELRYDPEKGRVAYQPVTIENRSLVPKVIRQDHRYAESAAKGEK